MAIAKGHSSKTKFQLSDIGTIGPLVFYLLLLQLPLSHVAVCTSSIVQIILFLLVLIVLRIFRVIKIVRSVTPCPRYLLNSVLFI